jgi:hypothetical protein
MGKFDEVFLVKWILIQFEYSFGIFEIYSTFYANIDMPSLGMAHKNGSKRVRVQVF